MRDCKCARPSNTNTVGNPQDSLKGDPIAEGVACQESGMLTSCWRQPGAQTKPRPASGGKLIFLSFSLSRIPWPDSCPILTVGQEITRSPCVNRVCLHTKAESVSRMFRLKNYPSGHQENEKEKREVKMTGNGGKEIIDQADNQ